MLAVATVVFRLIGLSSLAMAVAAFVSASRPLDIVVSATLVLPVVFCVIGLIVVEHLHEIDATTDRLLKRMRREHGQR